MTEAYEKVRLGPDDEYRLYSLGPGNGSLNGRTIAMLDEADRHLPFDLAVVQGSYMGADQVSASAGTHSGGGAIDISTQGHSADEVAGMVLALREAGFAAWHRNPSQGPWPDHIHAVAIGDKELSAEAQAQVLSYQNGGDGLAGSGADDGPDVAIQTFDYQEWIAGVGPQTNASTIDDAFDPDPGAPVTHTNQDGDGLTDEFELLLGTDPTKVDTDHDGLSDDVETYQTHTNPLVADDPDLVDDLLAHPGSTAAHPARIPLAALQAGFGGGATLDHDRDGLSDLTEAQLGSDVYNSDTDADGVSDGIEHRLGSNLQDIDTDNDGLTDDIEYSSGSLDPGEAHT